MIQIDEQIHYVKDRIEELAKQFKLIPSYFEDSEFPDDLLKFAQAIHNEALELAAKECETLECVNWNMFLSGKPTSLKCSEAIRKLKV
jgi:hypothetical protein